MTNPVLFNTHPRRQVLEETPARALKFLDAVGRTLGIRTALSARGYDAAEHERAWALLHKATGFKPRQDLGLLHDTRVRDAVATLDDWDDKGFRIAEATLKHSYPEQNAFVFDNLEPKQGAESVLSVGTFLNRLDALESAVEREATRAADHAALETLSRRGINRAERARLQSLVDLAKAVVTMPAPDDERTAHLLALYQWLEEWSEIARVTISRRDYLIALGLVKRRPKKKPRATPDAPPVVPIPPAPPVAASPVATPPVAVDAAPIAAPPLPSQPSIELP